MRVRYSFSSRRTGHTEKMRKQRQEYPDIVLKLIETADVLLEVLDSRFINETRNPELEELIKEKGKTIIYVFNKFDLVEKIDPELIKELKPNVFVSCKERKGIKQLRDLIKQISKKVKVEGGEKIQVGILGYPNTGKSSLINILIGKKSAGTGAEAGFTKGLQKLKLSKEIVLLDTPGVIPKSEYSSIEMTALTKHTKVGGRSYSQVRNPEGIVACLMGEYKDVFEKFYEIDADGDSEVLIEELGRRKNFLKKGGRVNEDQTSRMILKDWQEGKIKI